MHFLPDSVFLFTVLSGAVAIFCSIPRVDTSVLFNFTKTIQPVWAVSEHAFF
jgi:hypothetical protein